MKFQYAILHCYSVAFLLFLFCFSSRAQKNVQLTIIPVDSSARMDLRNEKLNFDVRDSVSAIIKLKEFSRKYQNKDYLALSIDSVFYEDKIVKAYLNLGIQYRFDSVSISGIPEYMIRKAGLKSDENYFVNLGYKDFLIIREKILRFYECNGYPFARLALKNTSIVNGKIKTELELVSNPIFKIDTLIFKGNPKISRKYFMHSIQIKKNSVYDQSKIERISKRVSEMYFIKLAKPVEIEFRESKADLYLYLANTPANYFSGMIGISNESAGSQNILFTGDVSLVLINSFRIGEKLEFNWNKFDSGSQNLKLGFNFPFIFILPVGVNFSLGLEKVNTSYLNSDINLSIDYKFSGNNGIKGFLHNKNSFILESDTSINSVNYAYKSKTGGVGLFVDNTDYRPNPGKGYFFETTIAYGKMINEDQESKSLYEFDFKGAFFYNLYKAFSLGFLSQSSGLLGSEDYYQNQLYKIGGMNTIRGFDERSIFASAYAVFTLEPKLKVGRNSGMFIFSDLAWYESKQADQYISDWPVGIGAGMNIDTKAGIFRLIYAVGKQQNNPFKFSNSKVHFGFSTRF